MEKTPLIESAVEYQIGINQLVSLLTESQKLPQEEKAVLFYYMYLENITRYDDGTSLRKELSLIKQVQRCINDLLRGGSHPLHYYDTIGIEFKNQYFPQTTMYPIHPLVTSWLGIKKWESHSVITTVRNLIHRDYIRYAVVQPRMRYKGDQIDCIWPTLNENLVTELQKKRLISDGYESIHDIEDELAFYRDHPEYGYLVL